MSKITQSAKGRECQIRVPGVCNGNPETVVLAHRNGGGIGMKRPDWQGAYACSACHAFVDGGYTQHDVWTATDAKKFLYEGIFNTQEIHFEEGRLIEA